MLTESQLQLLRNAIDAETDPELVTYRDLGQTGLVADWYNIAHPSVIAWNNYARWADVQNAIDYTKYTPTVPNMPTDTAGTNRLIGILVKLNVQQNMLLGSRDGFVDATNISNVDAIIDTVTGIQAGVGGAVVAPGGSSGVNVANALTRYATRAEAVFGGTDVTKGTITAKVLTWMDIVTERDVNAAMALP